MKQADLWDIFKKASKSACTPTAVVFPDHLSPTPSTSLAMEIPGNIQETLITLNQQMKEISIQNTVIPRLTKIIRSGITFVSRNLH